MTVAERFADQVDMSGGLFACWPFRGRGGRGYGNFSTGTGSVRAARFALEQKLGRPIADGMLACHHCDNPPCCNPAHLFEGSPAENSADAVAKGRLARRLSLTAVAEIRAAVAAGAGVRAVAREHGVNHSTVSRIVRGELWTDRPAVAL